MEQVQSMLRVSTKIQGFSMNPAKRAMLWEQDGPQYIS
jgi:hypothetical protein